MMRGSKGVYYFDNSNAMQHHTLLYHRATVAMSRLDHPSQNVRAALKSPVVPSTSPSTIENAILVCHTHRLSCALCASSELNVFIY